MSRTSKALRRLSVPVLVGSVIMTGVSGLGFAGVANAATPGTLTLTTPESSGAYSNIGDPVQVHIVYAPASPALAGNQTIVVTASPNGYFVADDTTPSPTSGNSTTACTIAGAGGSCDVYVNDQTSQAVTVTASSATEQGVAPQSVTAHFDGLHFANCSQTGVNTTANCGTQVTQGSTNTQTLTYVQDGAPKGGVGLVLSSSGGTTFFTPAQPAGSGANGEGGAHYVSASTATCVTDAAGQCKFNAESDFNNLPVTITAQTAQGTTPYPTGATAQEAVNTLTNASPARLDDNGTGAGEISPPVGGGTGPQPGDAFERSYTLYAASGGNCPLPANSTSAQCTGATLANTAVTLTVDHGFFTPNCTDPTKYESCTFTTTPTANSPVGNLKSLGNTITVHTDASGNFTVTLGIARDAGFDDDGLVSATVTAKAGPNNTTVNPENPGLGTANQNCTTNPANGACPAPTTDWSTRNRPYNGDKVTWKSVDGSTISADPNHVPDQQARVLIVQATDQFGNLTDLGGNADIAVTKSGVGNLRLCNGGAYNSATPCFPGTPAPFNVAPSYNNAFAANGTTPAQNRIQADSGYAPAFQPCGICPVTPATPAQDGLQTDTATWNPVPVTNFLTYNAGPPASATYDTTSTKSSTAVVKFDFYNQLAQPVVTFTTTPSNNVTTSTVVTVSATVKDQFGNPVPGQQVQFIRSGPNESSCNPTYPGGYTKNTDAAGNAGFSFTCSAAGTSSVNVIVNDQSGNRLASGVQNVTFTNGTPQGTGTDPAFTINVGTILIGQCATLRNTSSAAEDILVKGAHAVGFTKIKNLPAGGAMAICPSTNSLYQASNSNKLSPQKTLLVKPVLTLVVSRNGQSAHFAGHIAPSLVGRSLQVFGYVDGGHVEKFSFGKTVAGGNYSINGAVNHPGRVVHFFTQTYADDFNTSGRSRVISVQF